jgi:hypothetical protein
VVDTVIEGEAFTQTVSGCTQQQSQTITSQEKHKYTGEIRPTGSSVANRTLTDYSYTRTAIGTKSAVTCFPFNNLGGAQNMWWQEIRNVRNAPYGYGYELTWAGTSLFMNSNNSTTRPEITSFTSGGYKYTRGIYKRDDAYYPPMSLYRIIYGICREKI